MLDSLPAVEGLRFQPEFITADDELDLLNRIRSLEFHEMKMRGVVAKRRVIHYGVNYSFETFRATPGPPIPEFLFGLRERAAAFAGVSPEDLAEALITEYSPGAAIGWHRDAPMFGSRIAGVSLLAPCRMRFQRTVQGVRSLAELELAPRSAYLLTGKARWSWQHSIPATKALRYSITFRTVRRTT